MVIFKLAVDLTLFNPENSGCSAFSKVNICAATLENESGSNIGITWSEEDNGKWFLNLMKNKFNEAKSLCQTNPTA